MFKRALRGLSVVVVVLGIGALSAGCGAGRHVGRLNDRVAVLEQRVAMLEGRGAAPVARPVMPGYAPAPAYAPTVYAPMAR
jgi:hypothetical protein